MSPDLIRLSRRRRLFLDRRRYRPLPPEKVLEKYRVMLANPIVGVPLGEAPS